MRLGWFLVATLVASAVLGSAPAMAQNATETEITDLLPDSPCHGDGAVTTRSPEEILADKYGCGAAAALTGEAIRRMRVQALLGNLRLKEAYVHLRSFSLPKPVAKGMAKYLLKGLKSRAGKVVSLGLMAWGIFDVLFRGNRYEPGMIVMEHNDAFIAPDMPAAPVDTVLRIPGRPDPTLGIYPPPAPGPTSSGPQAATAP